MEIIFLIFIYLFILIFHKTKERSENVRVLVNGFEPISLRNTWDPCQLARECHPIYNSSSSSKE